MTAPRSFAFTVTITAETPEAAVNVLSERIGYDEDYGFVYTIDSDYVPQEVAK